MLIISLIILAFVLTNNRSTKEENNRLTNNQSVLYSKYKTYKTNDSLNAIKVSALSLNLNELKENEQLLIKDIKSLKTRLKNVKSITQVITQTEREIEILTKDSFIYIDTAKCFHFKDEFTTIDGCFQENTVGIYYSSTDELTTVVKSVPKFRFLWMNFGVKAIELDILSKNPYTKFNYSKYIEISK